MTTVEPPKARQSVFELERLAATMLGAEVDDVLLGLVMVKFESIAHHGARFLRGEADRAIVSGQAAKIRTALDLHTAQ